jgi:prevent-host-death family protein
MEHLSTIEAKRKLSRVVNKVAFGHEPVILTSRGRPKAVLLSHEDFLRLTGGKSRNIVRLGGLWKGTPPISERTLRTIRAEVWKRLALR